MVFLPRNHECSQICSVNSQKDHCKQSPDTWHKPKQDKVINSTMIHITYLAVNPLGQSTWTDAWKRTAQTNQ